MFEIIHHTADFRIRVEAPTLEKLFADALQGLMEFMADGPVSGGADVEEVVLDAPDTTALLVDFLNEALTRAHLRRALFSGVQFAELGETHLRATLHAAGAAVAEDVKAVTYHEADVRRTGSSGWTTMLVLDV